MSKSKKIKVKFYGRFNIESEYTGYFDSIAKTHRKNSKGKHTFELKTDYFDIQDVLLSDSKMRKYLTNLEVIKIQQIIPRLILFNKLDEEKKEGLQSDIKTLKKDLKGQLKDQIKSGSLDKKLFKKALNYLAKSDKKEIKELWNKQYML